MRLIDADALRDCLHIKEKCEDCQYFNKDCSRKPEYTLRDVCGMIDEVDVIDAIPIAWISVNDKLPEKQGDYLVYTEEDGVFSAEYNPKRERSQWTDDYEGYCDLDVTHWMPLPEPPRTNRNDVE